MCWDRVIFINLVCLNHYPFGFVKFNARSSFYVDDYNIEAKLCLSKNCSRLEWKISKHGYWGTSKGSLIPHWLLSERERGNTQRSFDSQELTVWMGLESCIILPTIGGGNKIWKTYVHHTKYHYWGHGILSLKMPITKRINFQYIWELL